MCTAYNASLVNLMLEGRIILKRKTLNPLVPLKTVSKFWKRSQHISGRNGSEQKRRLKRQFVQNEPDQIYTPAKH